ncbi:SagB/ThcOx family dehydrogenase [Bacteroides pyogenes]|uniref:SagB/ThcOx family dehydrogenase n=1 Tax=Bacteroides pyogenes TaxID=310300 RepID=UPI00243267B1
MRKLQLFLLCSVFSFAAAFAVDKVIELPKPNLNRGGTVMKALSERQSTREYASKALSLSDLSDLLWAANGVNRSASGKRTAPSAMNKQEVDIYVVLPQGSYLYDAKSHRLHLVAEGDHRGAVAAAQDFVKAAPVSLVLVSDIARFGDAGNTRYQLIGAMDAGIVSQNISVFCAAAHLATVPRATMDDAALQRVLKLRKGQMLMLNHPVGYFK